MRKKRQKTEQSRSRNNRETSPEDFAAALARYLAVPKLLARLTAHQNGKEHTLSWTALYPAPEGEIILRTVDQQRMIAAIASINTYRRAQMIPKIAVSSVSSPMLSKTAKSRK